MSKKNPTAPLGWQKHCTGAPWPNGLPQLIQEQLQACYYLAPVIQNITGANQTTNWKRSDSDRFILSLDLPRGLFWVVILFISSLLLLQTARRFLLALPNNDSSLFVCSLLHVPVRSLARWCFVGTLEVLVEAPLGFQTRTCGGHVTSPRVHTNRGTNRRTNRYKPSYKPFHAIPCG